jgi:ABC-type uncharacterized transport system substrate-binding protein
VGFTNPPLLANSGTNAFGGTTLNGEIKRPMAVNLSKTLALAMAVLSCAATAAAAHPHVFAETKTEVVGNAGRLEALRHVWRFDEFFSSTVQLEFDKDGDNKLSEPELAAIAATIKKSTAEFNYFQNVYDNGREVQMAVPGEMTIGFEGPSMILVFESKPSREVDLKGNLTFGIFDETFYTSLDFINDTDLSEQGFPEGCSFKIVRPDPDEAIKQNEGTLTEQFFAESAQNDLSKMFATRLEAKC